MFPSDLFSSKNYAGVNVHQLESATKEPNGKIHVHHPEAFLLTQWLERGVFEALEQRYLKSMIFAVYCKNPISSDDMLLETYSFSLAFPEDKKKPIVMNGVTVNKDSLKKQAGTFIRSLVEFSGTLEGLPDDRWLTVKLSVYYIYIPFTTTFIYVLYIIQCYTIILPIVP